MLARQPTGCGETLMLAHGFSVTFLADLVFDGLAPAELNDTTHVVRMQITDLGRVFLVRRISWI
jgi:hypothetical protein